MLILWGLIFLKISEITEELRIFLNHRIDSIKYKIYKNHYFNKLHFGSGNVYLKGWTNIDFHPEFNSRVDLRLDLRRKLPFKKESIETIFTEHVFEHFTPQELSNIFTSCRKILKKGGVLLFSVPDYVGLSKEFFGNKRKKPRFEGFKKDVRRFGENIHLKDDYDYYDNLVRNNFSHKYFYTDRLIRDLLMSAGFTKVSKRKPVFPPDSRERRSFSLYYKAAY